MWTLFADLSQGKWFHDRFSPGKLYPGELLPGEFPTVHFSYFLSCKEALPLVIIFKKY